ncbi:hypothetical protein OE810_08680 [Rhodobacteraceae bacterium XHP0102]|nr:hypothetical protein [Rhodobacteraceae bacterium XHP0102]
MLGLAPIAAAPLADDGDRLSRIQSSAVGEVALGGDSAAHATIGDKANQGSVFSLGNSAAGNGSLSGRGVGGLTAVGYAHVIGAASAIAAGAFTAINTAAATSRSAGIIKGGIELAGQGVGRTKGSGELRGLWNGHGAAAARSATLASGSGRLKAPGDAQSSARLQSGVEGSFTLKRQLEADAILEGTAAYGIGIDGATKAAVQTLGIGTLTVILAGPSAAGAVQRAAANGTMPLGGSGRTKTVSTSRATSFGPALSGFAIGTTLAARFADITGRLGFGVSTSAAVEAHAIAGALFAGSMEALGNVSTCSAITGGLFFARELDAGVMASGEAHREIGLAGAASGSTVAAAEAAAVGLEVTVASEARGASVGTVSDRVTVYGQTEMVSAVAGAATTTLASASVFGATTGSNAVVEAEASLQGENCSANRIYVAASTPFGLSSQIAGAVRPVARGVGQFDTADSATGGIASLGQGRGTLDVARDFAGDVDVLADSTPAIAIVGHATVQTVSIGTVTSAAVNFAGSARATNASHAQARTLIALSGLGIAQGGATASSLLGVDSSLFVAGIAPLNVESIGTWSAAGQMDAKTALAGSAETVLPIKTGAETHTDIAATANAAITLTCAIAAKLGADGSASDTFTIHRGSDTAVAIDADASRTLALHGQSKGLLSIAADPHPSKFGLEMLAAARSWAAGSASLDITTPVSATARAKSRASSRGRLEVDPAGSVDVLVLGEAVRGMPLFGASEAHITALAAANSIFAPGLTASADNVIQLNFTAEAIAADVRAAGAALAEALEVNALWDLGTSSIAYRAPPALRRAEPPKYGLSGRLSPSNSGRILRG